jgi:hypothetical protein
MLKFFLNTTDLNRLTEKEINALENSIFKKCEVMLKHVPLLKIIFSQVSKSETLSLKNVNTDKTILSAEPESIKNLEFISSGLLNILKSDDEKSKELLFKSLIKKITLKKKKIIVEFKIPGQEIIVLNSDSE